MYKGKKIAVVTAAYNEALFIGEVVRTMPSFVDRIYVVNDCSTDDTASVLTTMNDRRLTVISHTVQKGVGGATISGYKRACDEGFDVIAVMNGDGQMDPALLGKIIDPVVESKADYSKGDRLSHRQNHHSMPKWRLFGNSLLNYIIKIASGYWHVTDPLNGYTAISSSILQKLDLDKIEQYYTFETDLLVKLNVVNARIINVAMPSRYRDEKSKIVYGRFILKMSLLIIKDFIWRLWTKYVRSSLRRSRKS